MAFTKLQGATSDTVGSVMRGWSDSDWRDADAWLDEVMTTHDGPDVYAKVFQLSGVAGAAGSAGEHFAGQGIAQRIRERLTND